MEAVKTRVISPKLSEGDACRTPRLSDQRDSDLVEPEMPCITTTMSRTRSTCPGNDPHLPARPKEEVRLGPGETFSVRPKRSHLVINGGDTSATFLVLQGIGEYDFVR